MKYPRGQVIYSERRNLAYVPGKGFDLDEEISLMPGRMQTLTVDISIAPKEG